MEAQDTAIEEVVVRWQDLPATVLAHLLTLAPYKRGDVKLVCHAWRSAVNESLRSVSMPPQDLGLLHGLKAVQHLTAKGARGPTRAAAAASSNPWFSAPPSTLRRLKTLALHECPAALTQLAEWQLQQAAGASCCASSDNDDGSSRPGLEALQELKLELLGDISDALSAVVVCQGGGSSSSSSSSSKPWPLQHLRDLCIRSCSFRGDATGALPQLPALLSLELSDCALQQLPAAVSACTVLTALRLSGNHIVTLPEDVSRLRHLKVLDLSANTYLESLGSGASALTSLTELRLEGPNSLFRDAARHPRPSPSEQQPEAADLSGDEHVLSHEQQLGVLPELAGLSSLRVLSLARNHEMRVLPAAVCQLPQLESLDASFCSIRYPNDELWECGELRQLLLGDNVLADVPEDVGRLQQLQELDIACRTLWRLPRALLGLKALRRLVLWTMAASQDIVEQLVHIPLLTVDFCEEPMLVRPEEWDEWEGYE